MYAMLRFLDFCIKRAINHSYSNSPFGITWINAIICSYAVLNGHAVEQVLACYIFPSLSSNSFGFYTLFILWELNLRTATFCSKCVSLCLTEQKSSSRTVFLGAIVWHFLECICWSMFAKFLIRTLGIDKKKLICKYDAKTVCLTVFVVKWLVFAWRK